MCNYLARIINALTQLVQTNLKSYDMILKLLIRLYNCFDGLAKYFFSRCKGNPLAVVTARFDTLVERIGKDLTPVVYDLITFINQVPTSTHCLKITVKSLILQLCKCKKFVLNVIGTIFAIFGHELFIYFFFRVFETFLVVFKSL